MPDPDDTTDLRSGPEINDALLAVLPLVGSWAGRGVGQRPADREQFSYAQRVSFAHDGRPFLEYRSQSWLLDPDGSVLRPAFRESGFLRVAGDGDRLELVLSTAAGIVEVFVGHAGDRRWELATSAVAFTPTAKRVAGELRLYAIAGESLAYVQELAIEAGQYQPHLNARLERV